MCHIRALRFDEQGDIINLVIPLQIFISYGLIFERGVSSQVRTHGPDSSVEDEVDDFVGDDHKRKVIVVDKNETDGAEGHVEREFIAGHGNEVGTALSCQLVIIVEIFGSGGGKSLTLVCSGKLRRRPGLLLITPFQAGNEALELFQLGQGSGPGQ